MSENLFESIDVGALLPGCSLPVVKVDGKRVHAFREFKPLVLDGLSTSARQSLATSMVDVIRSLDQLHQSGYVDGNLTANTLHQRGTASSPAATLWIDTLSGQGGDGQTESVHAGDPEAMYWTAARVQSGAAATTADDWYALGVILAESAMSSASVLKIWELSRQDGQFAESLVKNLKRADAPRRMKDAAIRLIREGESGHVDPATISKLSKQDAAGRQAFTKLSLAMSAVVMGLSALTVYSIRSESASRRQEIAALEQQVVALQDRAEELSARPVEMIARPVEPSGTVIATPTRSDRDRWKDDIAGRTLEEVIADSGNLQPSEWVQRLTSLHSVPGHKQWRAEDLTLRRSIQRVVDQPWDDHLYESAFDRLSSIGEAYSQWQYWSRSGLSLGEIRTRHGLMAPGLVKDFLGQWLSEMLDIQGLEITISVMGVPSENETVDHLVGMETETAEVSEVWLWDSADGKKQLTQLKLPEYRIGDQVSVWLQQDSSIPYWNTTVLQHVFRSPLLVWQLSRGLRLDDSKSQYGLLLTTGKRVGPPPRLQSSSVAIKPVEIRKTINPLDELPFGLE